MASKVLSLIITIVWIFVMFISSGDKPNPYVYRSFLTGFLDVISSPPPWTFHSRCVQYMSTPDSAQLRFYLLLCLVFFVCSFEWIQLACLQSSVCLPDLLNSFAEIFTPVITFYSSIIPVLFLFIIFLYWIFFVETLYTSFSRLHVWGSLSSLCWVSLWSLSRRQPKGR